MKPVFRITANRQDITDTIQARLVSLSITDESGFQSDRLDLVLADHDDDAPIQMPPTGAELDVWLGYDDQAARVGLFIVDALELSGPPDRLTIRAKAAPQDASGSGAGSTRPLLQTHKTRSWEPMTLGELARSIAAEHGLGAAVAPSLASIQLPHVDQVAESDMNLLTRLANNYDAIAKPAGGYLVLAKRGESKTASGAPLPGIVLRPVDVTTRRMTLEKRDKAGTVVAVWHDVAAAVYREVTVGDGEPVKRLTHPFPDAGAARSAAQAELAKAGRGERKLFLTLPGRADLVADGRVTLQGFGRDGYNGEWLVTRVQHTLDTGGYRVSLEAEVPSDG